MATQDFLAQDDTTFSTIRYYTAADPYYYTVDNRPIQDIETNLKDARKGGGDAARRAAILGALNASTISASLFTTTSKLTGFSGLRVVQVSGTVARITPGSIYDTRSISTSITDATVKQALLTKNKDFTITAPVSAGTSIVYTIEGLFVELDSTTMASSDLPYVDATNQYLPSTLMNGELKLFLIAGTAATTGTEVPAATTAGRIPLYNITIAQGASTYKVSLHANAPMARSVLAKSISPVALASGGATSGMTNEISTFTFADSATSGVTLPFSLGEGSVNPYKPVKLRLTYASTVTGGAVGVRLRYKGFTSGELLSASTTATNLEYLPVSSIANAVNTAVTTIAIVPNSEFAGFVSGNWLLNKEHLNIILERVGTDSGDTNTGTFILVSAALIQ